jgi:hypothetical protein
MGIFCLHPTPLMALRLWGRSWRGLRSGLLPVVLTPMGLITQVSPFPADRFTAALALPPYLGGPIFMGKGIILLIRSIHWDLILVPLATPLGGLHLGILSSLWGVISDFSRGSSLCLPPPTSVSSTWGVSSWCYICGIICWWFKFSVAVFAPCGCPFFFQFGLDHVFPDSGSGGPPCGCSSDSSGSWHSSVGAFSSDAIGSSSPTSPSTSSGSLNRAP